jgi:hypothetical protein
MSFWKSLFGSTSGAAAKTAKREDYNGYTIEAAPYPADGQFQVAGVIAKDIDGARKEHRFVRADRFSSQQEAADFSITKAKQIIDQSGDRMFQ